jgi:predicted TPR repeat methyltransferase
LADDPEHADAMHWLGVLLFQAGQIGEAVTRLEQAAAQRPDDPAFQHNLAQAYLAARRDDEAIAAFQRSRAAGADAADLHFGLGVALLRKKRFHEAITAFCTALTKNPGLAPAHYHLAVAYRATRQASEARKALLKALELDSNYAAAWHALGVLDREAGNHAQADASLRKAQELRGGGGGGSGSGSGSDGMQPPPRSASVAELERRLTPDDSMRKLHDMLADAVGLAVAPTSLAREQVAELFDRYAEEFDAHLRDKLGYRVPEMIAQIVGQLRPQGGLDVLDLGCGTGLCGPLLRPLARTLAGVDLSAAMIEKARGRGVYDRLEVADLVDALCAAPRASFDLLVAADVLNYIGDLAPTMEAATAALPRDGLFSFSVEASGAGEGRFQLRAATHRYAHAEAYLRHVADIYGFDVRSLEAITIRKEANSPVNGYLVTLQRC